MMRILRTRVSLLQLTSMSQFRLGNSTRLLSDNARPLSSVMKELGYGDSGIDGQFTMPRPKTEQTEPWAPRRSASLQNRRSISVERSAHEVISSYFDGNPTLGNIDLRKLDFEISLVTASSNCNDITVRWSIAEESQTRPGSPKASTVAADADILARDSLHRENRRRRRDRKKSKQLVPPMQAAVATVLEAQTPRVRYELGKTLNLRRVPQLRFVFEAGGQSKAEWVTAVEELLNKEEQEQEQEQRQQEQPPKDRLP